MEEALNGHLMDFVMTLLGTAVFALIGFVWRISHKVADNTKRSEELHRLINQENVRLTRDIDMIMSKVDKHGEWTTNRMMSIVKDMPRD